jgi:hypothetical protein
MALWVLALFSSFALFLNRRLIVVKAITRAFCLVFVAISMLGVAGCGPDNEAEGTKAGQKLGDPGKPAEGTTKLVAPPKTSADRAALGPQGSINAQSKQAPAKDAAEKK